MLEDGVIIHVSKPVDIGLRLGISGEKQPIQFGDLEKMYENLKVGDRIAFRVEEQLDNGEWEVDKIIFTGK